MNGGKRGNSADDYEGDNGPKGHWDSDEEQESCCLVRCGVREATMPVHHEGRYLIHNFYRDDYPCPQP